MTLYIAADANLQAVRNLIKREQVSSGNVKDNWTRTQVQSALRNILVYLSELKEVPSNGLVLFASSDGVESIDPPTPNRANIYRCGSTFYRAPLDAMLDDASGDKFGLILIDNREATVGWFRGETVVALWHDFGQAMPKTRMGGMSQHRYQNQHDQAVKAWQRQVAEVANGIFLPMGIKDVLVAGPGWRKRALVEDGKLDYRLKVIAIVDSEYCDDVAGPREAVARWRAAAQA